MDLHQSAQLHLLQQRGPEEGLLTIGVLLPLAHSLFETWQVGGFHKFR